MNTCEGTATLRGKGLSMNTCESAAALRGKGLSMNTCEGTAALRGKGLSMNTCEGTAALRGKGLSMNTCEGTPAAMAAAGTSTAGWSTRPPLDSTVKMENANGDDWQEEIYEKIKFMKEMYFLKLSDLSQKIVCELQKNSLHRHLTNEQIEKLKMFKVALERILHFLGLNKCDVQLIHKEKLLLVEKHIKFFLNPDQLRKPTSSPLQEQPPQSNMQFQQPQSLDGQTNPPMQPVQGSMEASLDSTSQKGNTNGAHWQELVYKKIKSMKEMYFLKLSDLSQKIVRELQKNFLHQRRTNEQIEKLKMFKVTLERILRFLGLNKHEIQLIHKEKLLLVEKQISFFLNPDQLQKPTTSPLQEQLPQSSMQLQQPQSLDGQTNPSMQLIQHSMVAMPQNYLTNLQHNCLSGGVTISYSQQHMITTVQTGFSVDLGQGNSLNSLQPVITVSLQQRPVNSTQQVNISSQSGMNPIQANLVSLQQNSSTLQQSLLRRREQQLLQIQPSRQQYHHRQMQQRRFQRRELRRQQQMLQNQQLRQLHHHQQMQQLLFQRQQLRLQLQMLQNQQLMQQQQASQRQTTQQSSMQLQQPQSPDGRN